MENVVCNCENPMKHWCEPAEQNISIQQIAEAAGVDEAAVQEWIEEK